MLQAIPKEIIDVICSYVGNIDMEYKMEWKQVQIQIGRLQPYFVANNLPYRNAYKKYLSCTNPFDSRYFWTYISLNTSVPVSFLEEHVEKLSWVCLMRNPIIPMWFYEKYVHHFYTFPDYSNHFKYSWEFIQRNPQYFNLIDLSQCRNIPMNELEEREWDWKYLCVNTSIPVWFFEKHIDKLDWTSLCKNTSIPIKFFERHIEYIHWTSLCMNPSIPAEFFEQHIDKLDWVNIVNNPSLPEWFIDKYFVKLEKCPWYTDRSYTFSMSFLEKYIDKIHWYCISGTTSVPIKFFEKYIDRVCWSYITTNTSVPMWFFEKYSHLIDEECLSNNETFIQYIKDKENKEVLYRLFYNESKYKNICHCKCINSYLQDNPIK